MLHSLLSKAAALILAPLIFGLSLAGHPLPVASSPSFGASNAIETPIALFSTSLASSVTSSASSMTLTSATTLDGSALASSTYPFIIDEGSASQEFVKADCTSTACVRMARGLSSLDGTTTVAALQFAHRRGASVKITSAPILLNITRVINGIGTFPNVLSYTDLATSSVASTSRNLPFADWIYRNFANKSEDQTLNGLQTDFGGLISQASSTFTTTLNVRYSTASSSAASVGFANQLVAAGCPNSDTGTKGCVQEATQAQVNVGTQTGNTGAELFVNPTSLGIYSTSTYFSTTTVRNLSTTTIPLANLPNQNNITIKIWSPYILGSASTSDNVLMACNFTQDPVGGAYNWSTQKAGTAATNGRVNYVTIMPATGGSLLFDIKQKYVQIDFSNATGTNKLGTYTGWTYGTSSNSYYTATEDAVRGVFSFATSTTRCTSVDIWLQSSNAVFGTSTKIEVFGK